jgi:hypothetical protein
MHAEYNLGRSLLPAPRRLLKQPACLRLENTPDQVLAIKQRQPGQKSGGRSGSPRRKKKQVFRITQRQLRIPLKAISDSGGKAISIPEANR